MSDNSLYTRLLLPKRHGYPLSCPTPYGDAPLEARRAGTEIGDVGVIMSDGSFDVIFNICRASDDPINRFGVPSGFERVHVGPEDVASLPEFHDPGSHVSNATINKRRLGVDASAESNVFLPLGAGAVVEISTSSKEAAVLLLPDGASRANLRPLKEFRDYAIKHAQRWYEFVNGNLRRMVENGDLYLVTGMDKTSSWSIAAAENQSEDCRISLTLKAAQVGAAHASYIWEWEAASSFAACGPRRPPEEQSWGQNQTVFLRGYKVAIRSIPLKKSAKALSIVNSKASDILSKSGSVPFSGPPSGSGFSSFFRGASASGQGSASDDMGSPPSSDSSGASDKEDLVEYFPHSTKSYHPGCAINEYMLSSTVDAMVAVTHDEEWMSLLNEDDEELPQDCELVRRISYKYNIEGAADGVWLTMLDEEVSNPEAHPKPFTPAELDLDLGQDPVLSASSHDTPDEYLNGGEGEQEPLQHTDKGDPTQQHGYMRGPNRFPSPPHTLSHKADTPTSALLNTIRKRAIIACKLCKKRKIKAKMPTCVTTEDPPRHPCARCTKRGLTCEYVAVEEEEPNSPLHPMFPPPYGNAAPRYPTPGASATGYAPSYASPRSQHGQWNQTQIRPVQAGYSGQVSGYNPHPYAAPNQGSYGTYQGYPGQYAYLRQYPVVTPTNHWAPGSMPHQSRAIHATAQGRSTSCLMSRPSVPLPSY
ncbi:hypothetical protein DFH08DRAFT_1074769 [Mycena albidolilacea]|uniref:Zn(2)-C6 fungal-type domain-containing protein n=1 Tax=Mycena albidolilacea TaxID=1033008 RepID=A0AAD7AHT9_9AGAR|nr:hypothetical protein DFH08DRAFT_1074769 [Mycena albidolilacea]